MNISLLSKLFGKKKTSLKSLEAIPVSKLKKFAKEHNYPLFENTPIFYHSKKMVTPIIMFIPKTGLIIFEYKDWNYTELRDATVSKTSNAQKSDNSLSFENLGDFIKEKFIDLTTFDDIDIFNFVILGQLREDEFKLLDSSFQTLLPKERILFEDSTADEMEHKFKTLQPKQKTYTIHNTLPFIFTQYMIPEQTKIHFANEDQRDFIDKKLHPMENLTGDRLSGKSTLLLQKALLEKLKNPHLKIALITPSYLQKELLRQTLLDLVEHSAIVLDMNDIALYTPEDIQETQKRAFENSDMIYIDDAFLMDAAFIKSCKKLSKNKTLLLVNAPEDESTVLLPLSYYGSFEFIHAAEFPTLMRKLHTLLKDKKHHNALIFTMSEDFEAIKEDIENFCATKLSFLNSNDSLHSNLETELQLCNYDKKIPLHAAYTFLIQGCQSDYATLKYLAKSSKIKSFIIYQEECDTIKHLKESLDAKDSQK